MFPEGRPVLCLITDRRRLFQTIGSKAQDAERLLLDQITGAISGGVDVVQIRERDLDGRAVASLTRRCLALAKGSATQVVVNDRLDVAIATGAAGVHLREDSFSIDAARRVYGGDQLVGRSIHSPSAARAMRHASYLIAGSIFPTSSKRDAIGLGLDGLREVVRSSGECPVWAVGGITAARLPLLVRAGARGMAAIGAFIPTPPVHDLVGAVQKLVTELRFSFDSSAGLS